MSKSTNAQTISHNSPCVHAGPLKLACVPCTAEPGVPAPDGLLLVLARLVMERDNALRSAALGAIEVAYAFEGDGELSTRSEAPIRDGVRRKRRSAHQRSSIKLASCVS